MACGRLVFSSLLLFLCAPLVCDAFLPVIMFHGYGGSDHDFHVLIQYIEKLHPGTPTFSLDLFNKEDSFTPLWKQVDGVHEAVNDILKKNNFTSYHLMCHSQGALVCRVMLQKYRTPIVHFLSLSGPHMGQYGLVGGNWIEKMFPGITTEIAHWYLYLHYVQESFSAANYWNDPFYQEEYLHDCIFLPVVNNQTTNPNSEAFKENFISMKKLALFGSPGDGVIQPWQSAFFGFWGADNSSMVEMKQQPLYKEDWIGLKKLDEAGKLLQIQVPNATHKDWLVDQELFEVWIEPLLV